jgi:hypothetical protein
MPFKTPELKVEIEKLANSESSDIEAMISFLDHISPYMEKWEGDKVEGEEKAFVEAQLLGKSAKKILKEIVDDWDSFRDCEVEWMVKQLTAAFDSKLASLTKDLNPIIELFKDLLNL